MQQVVRLLGDLGERYGTEHTYYDLRTPADAIKLLCINKPKLQEELVHAHEHGVGYRLIQAGTDLGYDDLQLPLGSNDLILPPVIAGSGDGTGTILVGVGLVAFAILTAGAGAGFLGLGAGLLGTVGTAGTLTAGTFVLGSAASVALGAIGTSLILGGVAQMLSPQPIVPSLSGGRLRGSGESGSTDGPQSVVRGSDGRQSYMFTSAANTVGVGATIPVVYGEVIAGSHLLSAKIEVADDSDPLKTAIKEPGPDTVTVGGETISGLTYASGFRFRRWTDSEIIPISGRNATIPLSEGKKKQLADVEHKSNDKRKNYMIFFELTDGLFDYVSGPGTTLVDGFITFEVSLKVQISGPDPEIGRFRVTVQGLLKAGQAYRWMQYIQYPDIDDAGNIYTSITIIDFRCDASCKLKVRQNGYNLFRNSSYNSAPITT
jgi:predicted phage tail protein